MSTNILSSLTEENKNLQKQIGCMNGIFQLFDRRHFLNGRRHNHKKLLPHPGHSHKTELTSERPGKNEKNVNEKQRISIESSRTSTSSSFTSFDHNTATSSETVPEPIPIKQRNSSSPDIRDVVKDSMYREPRGISIKTVGKEEGKRSNVMKHIDSPRPAKVTSVIDGTIRAKQREVRPKDPPRFSYDSRELRDSTKSSVRLKELPRLSLDSRHTRSSSNESRSSTLLTDLRKENSKQILDEPSSNKRSSVIAKLMGLEEIPDYVPEESKQVMILQKGPDSPRPSQTKPTSTSTSRFPLEKAPWMKPDTSKGSSQSRKVSAEASSTVYGEIEKRIMDLEFKRSGKDLRALKQILEAMQKTRQKLESHNADEITDVESQTSRCTSDYSYSSNTIKGVNHLKRPESSIIIMKPVKLVDKFGNSSPASSISPTHVSKLRTQDVKSRRVETMNKRIPKEKLPRNQNFQNFPSLEKKKIEKISKEYCSSPRSSGIVSPRLQQKQNNLNLGKARKQSQTDSGSPNRKLRVKSVNLQKSDSQISCYNQDDSASLLSESNNSLASQMDGEVTSSDRSTYNSKHQRDLKDRDHALRLSEEIPLIAVVEQPSPVSVLDPAFYGEDSPSPLKKISTHFTDDESFDADEAEWHAENVDNWQKIRTPSMGFEFTHDKLENMEDLVHKLELLIPVYDESTMDKSDSFNPDHQYINRVILASGILNDVSSIQLHSSGHLLNPNLFRVLEQNEEVKSSQKDHRKVLFDTVNEILVRKLSTENTLLGRKSKNGQELVRELVSEVELLQSVSNWSMNYEDDQIESILNVDMRHYMEDWSSYCGETSGLVLDIERLIFKDLISEIINDEITGPKRRHSRQLFTK